MVTDPTTLLTVMAHPDDAELWAGGTILRHIHDGGTVTIAVARHDPIRDSEAATGAQILGAHLYLMDDRTPRAISAMLAETRPDIVITHPTNDIHPDHRQCAEAVLAALPDNVIATGHPRRVYHCDGYNNLDQYGKPLDLPIIIDVSDHWHTKIAALQAHRTQPISEHFQPMASAQAALHGRRIGAAHAEAFRPIPVLGRLPATPNL